MLLRYYKINKNIKSLVKDIPFTKVGTYSPQLGAYLIKHGFDVEIVTYHPGLFTVHDRGKKSSEILKYFKERLKKEKSVDNRKALGYFIEFLEKGGTLDIKIPDKTDIVSEIREKRPLGALLTSNFLAGKRPAFNFHFNIISGIKNNFVYVNDPLWDTRGGKKKYALDEFLFGLYASSFGGLDNGCLIKIKKT